MYKPPQLVQRLWILADNDGWTVAHEAAQWGHLPADFDQWALVHNGVTVAHIASKNMILPESFTQWGMISHTHKGNTVAHFAAEYGHLPDNFSQWELVNGEGVSIADVAKMSCGPTAELYAKWILRNEWPDVSEDHDTHGSHLL